MRDHKKRGGGRYETRDAQASGIMVRFLRPICFLDNLDCAIERTGAVFYDLLADQSMQTARGLRE